RDKRPNSRYSKRGGGTRRQLLVGAESAKLDLLNYIIIEAVLCTSHDRVAGYVANDFAGHGAARTSHESTGHGIKCRDPGLNPARQATAANEIKLRVSQFAQSMTIFRRCICNHCPFSLFSCEQKARVRGRRYRSSL